MPQKKKHCHNKYLHKKKKTPINFQDNQNPYKDIKKKKSLPICG